MGIIVNSSALRLGLLVIIVAVNTACHRTATVMTSPYEPQVVAEGFAASDKYRLVWNDDPTTTMTIAWDQLGSDNPVVLYDTRDYGRNDWKYKYKKIPSDVRNHYEMNTHFVKLTKLAPGQNHYFVIKDEEGVSERFWFKTAPDKPESFTFIAGGDTKSSEPSLSAGRASNRMVSKLRPLFVLFAGDFTSGSGTDPSNWKQWLIDWSTLTTTADGRMIPIVPVHGNHENGVMANLVHIFDAPFQYGDSTNVFYSLSLGGNLLHVISLNSEIDEGGVQRDWLEKDLRENRDFTFKIASYHKPFWPHTPPCL